MLHRLYNIVRQWLWERSAEGQRRLLEAGGYHQLPGSRTIYIRG